MNHETAILGAAISGLFLVYLLFRGPNGSYHDFLMREQQRRIKAETERMKQIRNIYKQILVI